MFSKPFMSSDSIGFEKQQLRNSRVQIAAEEKEDIVKKMFIEKDVPYPPESIYFRVFKTEKQFEVWSYSKVLERYVLIHTYAVCENSGVIGPKRQEGDLQVPEGFYSINVFNPFSNYFLSLGIDYPNKSDSILTSNKYAPGGDIYIHGDCVSIGCIPLTDNYIKEVYLIAVKARDNGQEDIPIDIYPFKFNNPLYDRLLSNYSNSKMKEFWCSLKNRFAYFESKKVLPKITILDDGKYVICQ